jgi:ribosomal protein S4
MRVLFRSSSSINTPQNKNNNSRQTVSFLFGLATATNYQNKLELGRSVSMYFTCRTEARATTTTTTTETRQELDRLRSTSQLDDEFIPVKEK